jgi:hypothetical protein
LLFCITTVLRERWRELRILAVDQTMKERRIAQRRPVLMMGVIVFSEEAPRIRCKVRDISELGAGLEISASVNIPQEFDLVVEGIRRRCRFVWRSGTRVGVAFRD